MDKKTPLDKMLEGQQDNQKIELILKREEQEVDEIDLLELLKKLWFGKKLIIMVTLLALIVTTVGYGGMKILTHHPETTVACEVVIDIPENVENFALYQRVLTGDNLIDDKILAEVLDELALSTTITVQDVQNCLTLTDVTPQEQKSAGNMIHYVYSLSMNLPENSPITQEQAAEILEAMTPTFKAYVLDTFINVSALDLRMTDIDEKRYDYLELVAVMRTDLETMIEVVNQEEKSAPGFISDETDYTYARVLTELKNLKDAKLSQLRHTLSAYGISKDINLLRQAYTQELSDLETELAKLNAKIQVTEEVVADYAAKENIILVKEDGSVEYPTERELITQYDRFLETLTNQKYTRINLESDISYYRTQLQKLEAGTLPQQDHIENQAKATFEELKAEYTRLVEVIDTMMSEFYGTYTIDRYIDAGTATRTVASLNKKDILLKGVIGAMLGFMLSALYVLCKDWFKSLQDSSMQS